MTTRALILAAGDGTRLQPSTDTRPKVMFPLVGKPVLHRLLDDLVETGLRDIVMVVGYKGDMVKKYFGDGSRFGATISYTQQTRLTGEATAILTAEREFSGEDHFLAVDGDFVADRQIIENTLEFGLKSGGEFTVSVSEVSEPSQYGIVKLDGSNRILEIKEKPTKNLAPSNLAISSVYMFRPSIFDALKKVPHLERAMSKMVKIGAEAYAALWKGRWIDIGRPWDILRANRHLLERTFEAQEGRLVCQSRIPSSAKIIPPCYVGPNVEIMDNVVIRNAYIDANSRIGTNALIRDFSYIGKGSSVGYGSEVKNAVILDNTQIGHIAYVGDSIIGEDCKIGAGSITANLRFDGRTVRTRIGGKDFDSGLKKFGTVIGDEAQIGINVSIYPGRKIGSKAWVDPGVIVSKDIPAKTRVVAVQSLRNERR